MRIVVVDTSLAVKWIVVEPMSAEATAILRQWTRDDVRPVVPAWFICEISNVLLQRLRDEKIRLVDAQDNMRELLRFVAVLPFDAAIAPRAIELAETYRLGATYDCLYLAAAERLGCELWTADERFWRVASASFPFVKWLGDASQPGAGSSR